MKFIPTPLSGAFVIEARVFTDERGFLMPAFSRKLLAEHGCNGEVVEANLSFSRRAGTLRGMHFQNPPYAQSKLVRCTRGAIWDAIIDLRRDSATFKKWFGVELTAENRRQLYVPEGFAHGFVTLTDDSEVFYQIGNVYNAESSGGVRWNDPAFGIEWPREVSVVIERDATYPDFV